MDDSGGSPARGPTLTLIGRRERLWRVLRRAGRVVYAVAALAFVGLLASPSITGWMLDREKARLRAAGVPVTLDEVIPKVPPGKPNAADFYQKAFGLRQIPKGSKLLDERRPEDARWRSETRTLLAKNTAYLSLFEQASRIPDCAFPVNWAGGPETATMPHLARFREATRLLGARAVLLARDGKADEALAQCETVLRMADHARGDPMLVATLVAWAIRSIDVGAAESVLNTADPSPEACRALQAALARVHQKAELVEALRSESAVISSWLHPRILELWRNAYSWASYVGQTQTNLGSSQYLRMMDEQTDALALDWPDSYRRAKSVSDRFEDGSWRPGRWTNEVVFPVAAHGLQAGERIQARLDALQIALALKQYKAQRGIYPDSLATLRLAGYDIPRDRFTGKESVYRREGAGFLVYSLGPDMDDDNGRDFLKDERRKKKPAEHGDDLWDTDVPFRCTR